MMMMGVYLHRSYTTMKKLSIISNGAKKRDNEEIYRKYKDKLNYWLLELDKFKNE
mgnify:CR=1 FL=1